MMDSAINLVNRKTIFSAAGTLFMLLIFSSYTLMDRVWCLVRIDKFSDPEALAIKSAIDSISSTNEMALLLIGGVAFFLFGKEVAHYKLTRSSATLFVLTLVLSVTSLIQGYLLKFSLTSMLMQSCLVLDDVYLVSGFSIQYYSILLGIVLFSIAIFKAGLKK